MNEQRHKYENKPNGMLRFRLLFEYNKSP